jgi:hypothetical protein
MAAVRLRVGSVRVADAAVSTARPAGALCLVHLVWAPLGPERLAAFVDRYRRFDPGVKHELLVLWNGFAPGADVSPWRASLAGLGHEELWLERPVQDLGAYFEAVARHRAERYCFVNSYAEPLADGWLLKLDEALALPGVGIAGATGSWASTRSWNMHLLRLPGPYRNVLPPPRAMRQMMALEADRSDATPPTEHSRLGRFAARLRTLAEAPGQTLPFESFPAYHVRTNGFMIRRERLRALTLAPVRGKRDAYLLENGRRSITRQLQRQGLRALVVDCNGASYDHGEWHRSCTLWQRGQERLLMADNQTRDYAEADDDRRRVLAGFAWGADADPTLRGRRSAGV